MIWSIIYTEKAPKDKKDDFCQNIFQTVLQRRKQMGHLVLYDHNSDTYQNCSENFSFLVVPELLEQFWYFKDTRIVNSGNTGTYQNSPNIFYLAAGAGWMMPLDKYFAEMVRGSSGITMLDRSSIATCDEQF